MVLPQIVSFLQSWNYMVSCIRINKNMRVCFFLIAICCINLVCNSISFVFCVFRWIVFSIFRDFAFEICVCVCVCDVFWIVSKLYKKNKTLNNEIKYNWERTQEKWTNANHKSHKPHKLQTTNHTNHKPHKPQTTQTTNYEPLRGWLDTILHNTLSRMWQ